MRLDDPLAGRQSESGGFAFGGMNRETAQKSESNTEARFPSRYPSPQTTSRRRGVRRKRSHEEVASIRTGLRSISGCKIPWKAVPNLRSRSVAERTVRMPRPPSIGEFQRPERIEPRTHRRPGQALVKAEAKGARVICEPSQQLVHPGNSFEHLARFCFASSLAMSP